VLVTGGAVRDAFLEVSRAAASRRPLRDLDVAVPAGRALPFAEELARRLGSRVVAIGASPRGILHLPLDGGGIDVWELEADAARDLRRRDFTVNALAFRLPSWSFLSPEGGLDDLSSRRLAPTRPGVLLEDPLRVLRAARLLAELPRFSLSAAAVPELRRASRRLEAVAAERRLAELDRLLSVTPRNAAGALRSLEAWGALRVLLRGATARERREGIRRVGRMPRPSPAVARVLLLSPLGARQAREILRRWKATRRDRQLADRLLALAASGLTARSRREVVRTVRAVSPFLEETVLFLSSLPGTRPAGLVAALAPLLRDSRRRERVLRPRRPLDAVAVLRGLGVPAGPRFGVLLAELDVALASGEVRGPAAARRLLTGLAGARPR
jgi:tRNA nucleotidyltransferase (CCA-adding enzyme)